MNTIADKEELLAFLKLGGIAQVASGTVIDIFDRGHMVVTTTKYPSACSGYSGTAHYGRVRHTFDVGFKGTVARFQISPILPVTVNILVSWSWSNAGLYPMWIDAGSIKEIISMPSQAIVSDDYDEPA